MKKFLALALALIMVLSFAACGEKAEEPAKAADGKPAETKTSSKNADRVLHLSTLAPLTSFDACKTNNVQDIFVLEQTNDYLWHQNKATLEMEPRVADKWEWSADGLTLTLHIRDNAKFHNGSKVTVEDVLFSYQRAMEDTHHKSKFSNVDKIEKADDSSIKIVLKNLDAGFMVTTNGHACIVNKAEVEAAGEDFGTKPHTAGCGAYKWGKVEGMDSGWELEAFEDYFDGAAPIKKVTYVPITQAASGLISFEAGELDWYIAPMANWDDLVANKDYNTELVAANHQSYAVINYTNGEMADINLRKAIAYAIDKEMCNDVAYSGMAKVADYYFDPDTNVAAPKGDVVYKRDLDKAKEYLAKSCMPNGGKLSGVLQCSAGGYFEKIATIVAQNLKDIGLEVEVTPMQSATNMEIMREGKFFFGISGMTPTGDYAGARSAFTNGYAKITAEFDVNKEFDLDFIDKQFTKGDGAKTLEERAAAYKEVQDYIADKAVYLPIFHKVQPYVWTKDLNVPVNYQDYYVLHEWTWN